MASAGARPALYLVAIWHKPDKSRALAVCTFGDHRPSPISEWVEVRSLEYPKSFDRVMVQRIRMVRYLVRQ